MKYVVFLIDGMADYPLEELGGKTPLEAAKTPRLDEMAQKASFGTFLTLPEGFSTSSDVANMSVLGWDLKRCHTGRGAIESYGAKVPLDDDTVAFRMNLITVKGKILEDYSAGHITDNEAKVLIDFLNERLSNDKVLFRTGVSYRNLLYLKGKEFVADVAYEKPDSSQGLEWKSILPKALGKESVVTANLLNELTLKSLELLENHPVNLDRKKKGQNPANIIWAWSGGKKPDMPSFFEMYGKKGSIISAVDVILGLGNLGGMESVRPEGATGYIDTNYENKAKAALKLLKSHDFVYIHIEAADECSHLGDLGNKIKAIEDCDSRLIKTFMEGYQKDFGHEALRVMVLPDHPVPIKLRKHTRELVPFMVWGDGVTPDSNINLYNEKTCPNGKYTALKGRELMDLLFRERIE